MAKNRLFICKLFLVIAIAILVVGCGKSSKNGITLEQYNKLKTGMSYTDVERIVGDVCTKSAETELAGIKQAIYTCEGTKKGSAATITFRDDKLTAKVQMGLE